MKKALWLLLALLPGIALLAARSFGWVVTPVLYLRADLANLALMGGVLLCLGGAALLALRAMDQRQCQGQLARNEAEQGEAHRRFIRRLDHEIKNPLTAMRAALANLNHGSEDAAVGALRGQVDRLARLTGDLRKLAELESQPIERECVQLDQLLRELYGLLGRRTDAQKRVLRLTLPSAPWPLPPTDGDPDLLFLAFHNLLDNAIKFTRPADTVEVRAFEDGTWVVVEVADTGPGIPAEELPHVGEELYRGSSGRGVEGSGLGVALAEAIIAQHGGSLALRSRSGQGTVVSLRLPVGERRE